MQNREAGSTGKLNDNERYGGGEPKKMQKKYKFEKKFLGGVFWSNTFLVWTYEKKWEKVDVATTIVTGFPLQVTLARYRVEVVYLRGNLASYKNSLRNH